MAPPANEFYFPVGLQVSAGGTALYAVNSNFDLQYNGGTLQSYDLGLIRRHAADLIANPQTPNIPRVEARASSQEGVSCTGPLSAEAPLGERCAPAVDSTFYVRGTAVIGAFATGLVLSKPPSQLSVRSARTQGEPAQCPAPALASSVPTPGCPPFGTRAFDRLFMPVRGNASLTWASVERDGPDATAPLDPKAPYGPFIIRCGQDASGRCDGAHMAGDDPNEPGNDRNQTMPGEPFGIAMSEDGTALAITHQNEFKTSLFATGLRRLQDGSAIDDAPPPALKDVLNGVSFGGVGIASVPYDRDVVAPGTDFPRASFLQTSRAIAVVDWLRQAPDDAPGGQSVATSRALLTRDAVIPLSSGLGGADSRGIAIDPTPRLRCKVRVPAADPASRRTQADVERDLMACARKPARVFVANRTPASLVVGDLGGTVGASDRFDPDRLNFHTVVPLSTGPSKVYLAPIVDRDGALALRVFVVCFESANVFVIDPDTLKVESTIRVGAGPYAMAFDPFSFEEVAAHAVSPFDPREPGRSLRRYRFAYVASFTNSFVQLIDLDNAQPNPATFERVVFTLGRPKAPKGS